MASEDSRSQTAGPHCDRATPDQGLGTGDIAATPSELTTNDQRDTHSSSGSATEEKRSNDDAHHLTRRTTVSIIVFPVTIREMEHYVSLGTRYVPRFTRKNGRGSPLMMYLVGNGVTITAGKNATGNVSGEFYRFMEYVVAREPKGVTLGPGAPLRFMESFADRIGGSASAGYQALLELTTIASGGQVKPETRWAAATVSGMANGVTTTKLGGLMEVLASRRVATGALDDARAVTMAWLTRGDILSPAFWADDVQIVRFRRSDDVIELTNDGPEYIAYVPKTGLVHGTKMYPCWVISEALMQFANLARREGLQVAWANDPYVGNFSSGFETIRHRKAHNDVDLAEDHVWSHPAIRKVKFDAVVLDHMHPGRLIQGPIYGWGNATPALYRAMRTVHGAILDIDHTVFAPTEFPACTSSTAMTFTGEGDAPIETLTHQASVIALAAYYLAEGVVPTGAISSAKAVFADGVTQCGLYASQAVEAMAASGQFGSRGAEADPYADRSTQLWVWALYMAASVIVDCLPGHTDLIYGVKVNMDYVTSVKVCIGEEWPEDRSQPVVSFPVLKEEQEDYEWHRDQQDALDDVQEEDAEEDQREIRHVSFDPRSTMRKTLGKPGALDKPGLLLSPGRATLRPAVAGPPPTGGGGGGAPAASGGRGRGRGKPRRQWVKK